MRTLIVTSFTAMMGLFAASAVEKNATPWIDYTALGVLSGVLVFIVTKFIPGMIRDHRADIKEQRLMYLSVVKENTEADRASHKEFTDLLAKIDERQHTDSAMTRETLTSLKNHCEKINPPR